MASIWIVSGSIVLAGPDAIKSPTNIVLGLDVYCIPKWKLGTTISCKIIHADRYVVHIHTKSIRKLCELLTSSAPEDSITTVAFVFH